MSDSSEIATRARVGWPSNRSSTCGSKLSCGVRGSARQHRHPHQPTCSASAAGVDWTSACAGTAGRRQPRVASTRDDTRRTRAGSDPELRKGVGPSAMSVASVPSRLRCTVAVYAKHNPGLYGSRVRAPSHASEAGSNPAAPMNRASGTVCVRTRPPTSSTTSFERAYENRSPSSTLRHSPKQPDASLTCSSSWTCWSDPCRVIASAGNLDRLPRCLARGRAAVTAVAPEAISLAPASARKRHDRRAEQPVAKVQRGSLILPYLRNSGEMRPGMNRMRLGNMIVSASTPSIGSSMIITSFST